jgi:hypothetical protein
MDRRLFTMVLHKVEKRAINPTQWLLQLGFARAWLRRIARGLLTLRHWGRACLFSYEFVLRSGIDILGLVPFMKLA